MKEGGVGRAGGGEGGETEETEGERASMHAGNYFI